MHKLTPHFAQDIFKETPFPSSANANAKIFQNWSWNDMKEVPGRNPIGRKFHENTLLCQTTVHECEAWANKISLLDQREQIDPVPHTGSNFYFEK